MEKTTFYIKDNPVDIYLFNGDSYLDSNSFINAIGVDPDSLEVIPATHELPLTEKKKVKVIHEFLLPSVLYAFAQVEGVDEIKPELALFKQSINSLLFATLNRSTETNQAQMERSAINQRIASIMQKVIPINGELAKLESLYDAHKASKKPKDNSAEYNGYVTNGQNLERNIKAHNKQLEEYQEELTRYNGMLSNLGEAPTAVGNILASVFKDSAVAVETEQ